ncbi:MAG TPA: glycerol-3-phosphate acyltransferase [Sandaracinaceae bacterium LLY-WYZ-13_1]|nr:glycerol-3-phosphate acyltransferase [Sandaracinaceae bacterium LLY-WYZ-13_1]
MPPRSLGPAFAAGSYLLGSISFGLLAARGRVDLRAVGSGNVGATNVGRVLGAGTGRAVLALDAAKGALPTLGARAVLGADHPWTAATGVAAVVGHCYPLWHGFRGGKGAATAAGVMLAASPPAGLVAIAGYVGLKKATRRASIGSLGGALLGTATAWAVHGPTPRAWMTTAILAVVALRHTENVRRLLRGEEPPS